MELCNVRIGGPPQGRRRRPERLSCVRNSADNVGSARRGWRVGNNHPTPWNDAISCGICSSRLIPLTSALPEEYERRGQSRPRLTCGDCGQLYVWADAAGWAPGDSAAASP